ncbi:hypothetical protein INT43_007423 [Umbelopsis isabellina]|uniref:phosphatidylinositol-3,4,5-trisphosphate 3-phosphatase n=1 Tax=Mortierella isabellina TaxID=91625 RepID=A0A8H7PYA9_MORIS|nr:hypothetical protein INT43_007423 [Umbelopsis isabellina]
MLNGIRRLISGNRRRLVVDGFDLDLSYITDRVIATSYPSSGLEALYRNTYPEVKKYLDTHHPCHYKVYNLRNEKRYENNFFDETAEYTFKDHGAPQLSAVVDFCEDVCEYLSRDPENVVVVHCKAGKGRTGVMIASLLLKLREAKDAEEAMKIYGDQRTVDGRGVTIPSQRRYVSYFSAFLLQSQPAAEEQFIVHNISLLGQQNAVTLNGKNILFFNLDPRTPN